MKKFLEPQDLSRKEFFEAMIEAVRSGIISKEAAERVMGKERVQKILENNNKEDKS